MQVIASSGVKGGVGKSTFAILLAYKLSNQGKKIVLYDADVECPNDHLIINKELKNPEYLYQEFPKLDEEKCVKCGRCSEVCRENAVFWVKGKYPKFLHDLCTGCGSCWVSCPNNAITTEEKISGESFVNKVNDNFWLITGKSKVGLEETGPIVREVKSKAIRFAEENNADYLIIDTAPGTHCSVIQALLNCDKVYAVTEPTPLGSHDLGLVLKLVQRLDMPVEVVLNKSDVGDKKKTEEIASKFGTKISVEIPYSERLVKAYCEKDLGRVVDLI
ncbi:MAG: P-loop NTPase [Candidatus Aenigmarchaeota archaeon]|nr:P-loop NTPase [Candidatus Aenigmarchaeota archaeon]